MTFPTQVVELGDGDVVVWMSNGIFLGQDYGERRLLSWIHEVSDKSADKIRTHIERKLLALLGKKLPDDDVLFVVARMAPQGA